MGDQSTSNLAPQQSQPPFQGEQLKFYETNCTTGLRPSGQSCRVNHGDGEGEQEALVGGAQQLQAARPAGGHLAPAVIAVPPHSLAQHHPLPALTRSSVFRCQFYFAAKDFVKISGRVVSS